MTAQFFTRAKYDAMILYTGPRIPTANQTLEIESAFEDVLSEDFDGNGKREVSLNALFLMTDEQLKDDRYLYDEEGNALALRKLRRYDQPQYQGHGHHQTAVYHSDLCGRGDHLSS